MQTPELWVVNPHPSLLPGPLFTVALLTGLMKGKYLARWGGPSFPCQVFLNLLLTQNVRDAGQGIMTVSSQRGKSAVFTLQGYSAASGGESQFQFREPSSLLSESACSVGLTLPDFRGKDMTRVWPITVTVNGLEMGI